MHPLVDAAAPASAADVNVVRHLRAVPPFEKNAIVVVAEQLAAAVVLQPLAANRPPHLVANRLLAANPIPADAADVKVCSQNSRLVALQSAANLPRPAAPLPPVVVVLLVAPAVVLQLLKKRLPKRQLRLQKKQPRLQKKQLPLLKLLPPPLKLRFAL